VELKANLEEQIRDAASTLREGGVVAFPTETVYGIGADFQNESAVKRIYEIKQRKKDKPLVLLLSEAGELPFYVKNVRKTAQKIIETFWPGSLTLIFKASSAVPEYLLGPDSTVGTRVTRNETTRSLIEAFGSCLATTSANVSGEEPLRSGSEVSSALGKKIDYVLPGFCGYMLPSAVLNLSQFPATLERSGAISPLLLARTMRRKVRLGKDVFFRILLVCTGNACRSPMAEGLLREMVPGEFKRKLIIASAGTSPIEGGMPTDLAIKAAKKLGADISGLLSRELNPTIVVNADLILTMEQRHREKVAELVPEAWEKTHLLKGYGQTGIPRYEQEIRDPIGMPLEFYEYTAREIQASLKGVVSELTRWLLPL
jgi:tRNA threonylcarbamoyl adenosine modification protein (Sua5/YciO/YrdC/YwlC family)